MRLAQLLLILLLFIHVVPFKILVYNPRYGHSHSNFLGNIADILVDAGHDVTSLINIIDPKIDDGTRKSKKILVPRSDETETIMRDLTSIRADFFMDDNLNPIGVIKHRRTFALHFVSQCRALLNDTQMIENLRGEKFDVMIVENFEMCGVGLSHLLNPRSLITVAAAYPFSYMLEEFGIPLSLSYNPSSFITHLDVHSMWSRMKNIYANWLMHYYFYPRRGLVEDLFRELFGSDFPSLEEISSHSAYTLTNSEPLIDYATPTINRVISIGGIGAKQPKKVDEEWNTILSQRPMNILISFGSVAKAIHLPTGIKQSITTESTTLLPNLVLSSWMPQNDLLSDDRVVAFITHGGMGSTQETALRGKPGIFVPIFGDQPRNAGMMEYNGLGKVLDKFDLPEPDKVEAVIRELLTNEIYTKKARQVSAMLQKKPFAAIELLVKTVEFAAEFGPSKALRPQSYDMNTIQYHNIDVLAFSIVILLILIHAVRRVLLWMLSKCGVCPARHSKTKKD